MEWKTERKRLAWLLAIFLCLYFLPVGRERFDRSLLQALALVKWYAREHVLLCLVPAFFIAGAIGVFVSKAAVMKYLGDGANKVLAYGVAGVSGSVLAVCSCTILPLFAGIYRMGAGLGPATAFLYAGPAVNVLAIVLTARILGLELGIARGVGAVIFSLVIGLVMHWVFRREEQEKVAAVAAMPVEEPSRPLWQNLVFFGVMVAVLVFANWAPPRADSSELCQCVYVSKWWLTGGATLGLCVILCLWFRQVWWQVLMAGLPALGLAVFCTCSSTVPFIAGVVGLVILTSRDRGETGEWLASSWGFARQILPLLFFGVLVAGALLGTPPPESGEGLIPREWIYTAVGGNSLGANFCAALAGACMYFATLTEVPILRGLMDYGMGKGPALALLLAGPALSLPNMLVIRSIMGTKKTLVFVALVVVMATTSGLIYGNIF